MTAPAPARPPSRHAFTLLEILVSISIVGILAVMLMPAARGIIDKANTAKSTGNLQQIGVAVAAYVADMNGDLPSKDFNDPSRLWIKNLYERIYGKPWVDFVPYDTGANLKGTVFFSPALKPNEPKPWRSYGWNNYLQISDPDTGIVGLPPKLLSIPNPTRVILCGEVMNSSTLYVNKVAARHNGRALIMMADLHVNQMDPKNISTNTYDPMWRPIQ